MSARTFVAFALSAATFLNAKMAACWVLLAAGIQGGHEVSVTLVDKPGTRAVEPVLPFSARGKRKAIPGEKPLAYVAVLIGPPPR